MDRLFEIGDYIVYGASGVCQVTDIGRLNISADDKLYYTLTPVYTKASVVYTPVDNEKVIMRRLITKKEAEKLIKNINKVDELEVTEEKKREECYKQALRSCECTEWLKLMRTSYNRMEERKNSGKKVMNSDEKYLKAAEDYLYGELAIALDIDKDEVGAYIAQKQEK